MGAAAARVMAVAAAAVIATLAWAGIIIEYVLVLAAAHARGEDRLVASVRYFSFFTVVANLLIAVTLTARLLAPRSRVGVWLARPVVSGACALYILVVALVYELVLRRLWHPTGWLQLADLLLHDFVPALYWLLWIVALPKARLPWRTAFVWLGLPAAYLVYTLVRAPWVGGYPYPFLDAAAIGYGRVFANSAVLLVIFLGLGAACVAIDRALTRSPPK
jgi:hypothetical protein